MKRILHFDNNGAQEDLLAQAGKLQGWKVT